MPVHLANDQFNYLDFARVNTTTYMKLHSSWSDRMLETQEMPVTGWVVDVVQRVCDCYYFEKFGYCVHLIAALQHNTMPLPGDALPEPVLFNRRKARANRGRGRGGRPSLLGLDAYASSDSD